MVFVLNVLSLPLNGFMNRCIFMQQPGKHFLFDLSPNNPIYCECQSLKETCWYSLWRQWWQNYLGDRGGGEKLLVSSFTKFRHCFTSRQPSGHAWFLLAITLSAHLMIFFMESHLLCLNSVPPSPVCASNLCWSAQFLCLPPAYMPFPVSLDRCRLWFCKIILSFGRTVAVRPYGTLFFTLPLSPQILLILSLYLILIPSIDIYRRESFQSLGW